MARAESRSGGTGAAAKGLAAKVGVWLLVAVLGLHQVLTAAWAAPPAAAKSVEVALDAAICHANPEQPAERHDAPADDHDKAQHCGLCVVFCAAAWALPVAAFPPPSTAAVAEAALGRPVPSRAISLSLVFRPGPRAPPTSA